MTTHMYSHACVQFVSYFDFRLSSDQVCRADYGREELVPRGVVIASTNTGTRSANGTSMRGPHALLVNVGRKHRTRVRKRKQDE